MPSTQNQTDLQILKDKLSTAKSMAVVDFAGTTVNDQVDIRRNLRGVGAELYVTKNTLINLATDGKLKESLEGMNAVVISYEDEVGGLKVLFDWHDKNEKLTKKVPMSNLQEIYEDGFHVCRDFYGQRLEPGETCLYCAEILYR